VLALTHLLAQEGLLAIQYNLTSCPAKGFAEFFTRRRKATGAFVDRAALASDKDFLHRKSSAFVKWKK
jgi:hypothetical protein